MSIHKNYLFTSARLGFRNWELTDIDTLHQINTDEKVMEYFPALPTLEQTIEFVGRMRKQFDDKGFCYFAVDKLENNECIGFIGLAEQHYAADFTPCIDIGWRLASSEWNKGFATEGAIRCLDYAFTELGLNKVYSIAPKVNTKSEHIMIKIGLIKQGEFEHPLLTNHAHLRTCVVYTAEVK